MYNDTNPILKYGKFLPFANGDRCVDRSTDHVIAGAYLFEYVSVISRQGCCEPNCLTCGTGDAYLPDKKAGKPITKETEIILRFLRYSCCIMKIDFNKEGLDIVCPPSQFWKTLPPQKP